MKRLLLGTATAIVMATACAFVSPASARVDVEIGVPFIFDAGHDRCYDYWFRERHPDYCYYGEYNEYWWVHHHRGWDHHHHDWDDHHHHDHDWDDHHHHDHDHDHHDHDHDHHDHDHHDHDHHDHDHHDHDHHH